MFTLKIYVDRIKLPIVFPMKKITIEKEFF